VSKAYAAGLRARGRHGGIIACALAHRANRIAFAFVGDQVGYDPTCWPAKENWPKPFTTPAGKCHPDRTKGRIRRRIGYGTPRVMP
jgi:hypothetical protein